MENQIRPYDMQFMKMAILKHEQTFKEQVYELHRLYRIQKILMKNIPKSAQNGQINHDRSSWNSRNAKSHVIQIIGNEDCIKPKPKPSLDLESDDGDGLLEIEDDESQIELTLGPTSYYQKKKVETPINSDSGGHHSFSSSSTGSSHKKRTSSETQLSGHKWGLMEEHMRQDRLKQGPWIFQAMNLNMT